MKQSSPENQIKPSFKQIEYQNKEETFELEYIQNYIEYKEIQYIHSDKILGNSAVQNKTPSSRAALLLTEFLDHEHRRVKFVDRDKKTKDQP